MLEWMGELPWYVEGETGTDVGARSGTWTETGTRGGKQHTRLHRVWMDEITFLGFRGRDRYMGLIQRAGRCAWHAWLCYTSLSNDRREFWLLNCRLRRAAECHRCPDHQRNALAPRVALEKQAFYNVRIWYYWRRVPLLSLSFCFMILFILLRLLYSRQLRCGIITH